jgi:hypothetical protein
MKFILPKQQLLLAHNLHEMKEVSKNVKLASITNLRRLLHVFKQHLIGCKVCKTLRYYIHLWYSISISSLTKTSIWFKSHILSFLSRCDPLLRKAVCWLCFVLSNLHLPNHNILVALLVSVKSPPWVGVHWALNLWCKNHWILSNFIVENPIKLKLKFQGNLGVFLVLLESIQWIRSCGNDFLFLYPMCKRYWFLSYFCN